MLSVAGSRGWGRPFLTIFPRNIINQCFYSKSQRSLTQPVARPRSVSPFPLCPATEIEACLLPSEPLRQTPHTRYIYRHIRLHNHIGCAKPHTVKLGPNVVDVRR